MTTATKQAATPYRDPARVSFLRRRATRNRTVASVSMVVFLVVLAVAVTNSPGWPAVQKSFFDPTAFRESFPEIWDAFWLNVRMFLVAEPLILILGLLISLARGLRAPMWAPLRVLAAVWTDVFRGVPTLLLILLFGFGIPALRIKGLTNEPVVWGTVALVVSYSAYVAEVYRAGIDSVHPGQRAAARSLGLSDGQTSRFVVLPQAVRNVVPPLLNDFISLQKDTALVSVLGPIEALRAAQIYASDTFNYTSYVVAAVLFISLTIPMARYTDWLLARQRRRKAAGGSW